MNTFDKALSCVLDWEGAITNDPRDPGALTKYGISKRAYPDLDIASLTLENVAVIYHRDYWLPMRCDDLPAPVAVFAFDCAVNQGVGAAAMMLQQAAQCPADGVLGPQTMAAIKVADPLKLLRHYATKRQCRYAETKGWDIYGAGWTERLIDVLIRAVAS